MKILSKALKAITSLLFEGNQTYKGIYWGSKYEDAVGHSGAWAYIRQGPTQGQLEIGSDDNIDIYDTDSRVLAVSISTNNKTLDAKGGLLENGTPLASKYQQIGVSIPYGDLTGIPTIPSNISDLTNDLGFKKISIGTIAPTSPVAGEFWIDTN